MCNIFKVTLYSTYSDYRPIRSWVSLPNYCLLAIVEMIDAICQHIQFDTQRHEVDEQWSVDPSPSYDRPHKFPTDWDSVPS